MRKTALLVALVLLAPTPAPAGDPLDDAAAKDITAAEAKKAGMLLAGPKFLGRGTGQKGNDDAALWLASQLKESGFDPGPAPGGGADGKVDDADFLQKFSAARQPGADGLPTQNVVGILRGTGHAAGAVATGSGTVATGEDATRNEAVVLGAHFDHLGVQGKHDPKKPPKKSGVYWGADDNASGTTGALLVARALGRLHRDGVRPRRTIVVCFFSGEEIGLLGSKHYVSAPVIPLADTVAMINLDMVGRNAVNAMEVYGNTCSPELDAWHQKVLEETKIHCVYPSPDLLMRSDQWSFYEAGIPVLFLHGGLHKDYHSVRDVPEQLNYPKIAAIARHALEVLWLAAADTRRPTFRKIEMKGAGGALGIAVDPCTPEDEEGLGLDPGESAVRVTAVFAGGLGEKYLEVGDLVYRWNGAPLAEDDPAGRFNAFVGAARKGDRITIRYARGKERKAALVQF